MKRRVAIPHGVATLGHPRIQHFTKSGNSFKVVCANNFSNRIEAINKMLEIYFKECLFFTANRLSRIISKMAEDEFAPTGLSPTAAFLMMTVLEKEGISQKDICQALHLQPSTITRLIASLEAKGYLSSRSEGRMSLIFSTDQGRDLESRIHECWNKLRQRYNTILKSHDDELSLQLYEVSNQLENTE